MACPVFHVISMHPSSWHLRKAARLLRNGEVIAYPTEAIYGLGCDPLNPEAVANLLTLKQRHWRKGLILVASDFTQVESFLLPLPENLKQKIFATWPGPVTWLWPARPDTPPWLRGDSDKLAIRLTAHPGTRALCQTWGGALVSTSANLGGRPPARNAWQARRQFKNRLPLVLPGPLGGRTRPSEIRDALSDAILRKGN